jgi:hypothetical protein
MGQYNRVSNHCRYAISSSILLGFTSECRMIMFLFIDIYKKGNSALHAHIFSSNFCHHGSSGAAVDSPPSQQDPYLSPQKDVKLIACSVQELWCFKVCFQILTQ